jgi:hypothetical protein
MRHLRYFEQEINESFDLGSLNSKNKGLKFLGVVKGEDYEVDAEKYNL